MAKEKAHDSTVHNEERRARMQAEAEEQRKEQVAVEATQVERQAAIDHTSRQEETQRLTQQVSLVTEVQTRDQLLERIREMREEPATAIVPIGYMSDSQKEQLRLEQEAGAAAVKKAEQEMQVAIEYRKKAEAERVAREGTMETVHHPNPGQNEQFPAEKATLGKVRK